MYSGRWLPQSKYKNVCLQAIFSKHNSLPTQTMSVDYVNFKLVVTSVSLSFIFPSIEVTVTC